MSLASKTPKTKTRKSVVAKSKPKNEWNDSLKSSFTRKSLVEKKPSVPSSVVKKTKKKLVTKKKKVEETLEI